MKTILRFTRCERETRLSPTQHKSYVQMEWNVQTADPGISTSEARRFIEFWRPDGCIVNNDTLPASLFKGIPTVFTHRDMRRPPRRGSILCYDERAIAELAARELLSRHCASYVYIPEGRHEYWDRTREREFKRVMRTSFKTVRVFSPPPDSSFKAAFQIALANWIKALPRPIGIFASYDLVAIAVIGACYHADITIPEEAVILGVDNDVPVCENSTPTISSIFFSNDELDAVRVQMLSRLMDTSNPTSERRLVKPEGIMYRASTMQLKADDPDVIAARELIRTKSCEGLTASDVVRIFPCARRQAEIRFRKATGHSILAEIRAMRLDTARKLLSNGTKTDAVANLCGYASRSSLHRLITGTAPSSHKA